LKILVTGAQGLLGSAMKEIVQENDYHFTDRRECDLENLENTIELFEKVQPSIIIHLAAKVGGVQANSNFPADYFERNMTMNLNVFKAAKIVKANRIIAFASTCVFPDSAKYPLIAHSMQDGPPHASNYGYAYAKRMLAVLGESYRKQHKIDFNLLIPANMYGPDENWRTENGHVIPDLIKKISKAKQSGQNIEVWGSGRAKREFVFSKDVARVTLEIARNSNLETPLIITNGQEISIRELVEILIELMNFDGEVIWNTSKPEGQLRKPSSQEDFKRLFPNFEFTPFREGLLKTLSGFINQK
jgi:GDP-L-fucose synthase